MLHFISLAFLAYCCFDADAAVSYKELLGGKCFLPGPDPIAQTTAMSSRQCAIQCLNTGQCSTIQYVKDQKSCLMFDTAYPNFTMKPAYQPSDDCTVRTFVSDIKAIGYATFTSSGQFAVPVKAKALKIIAVGGGSGGCAANTSITSEKGFVRGYGQGGGSGYVNFAMLYVSAHQTFNITVGSGGTGGFAGTGMSNICNNPTYGQDSTFGGVLVAQGGTNSGNSSGGNGGSGGGSGTFYCMNCLSGAGGSAGSAGTTNNPTYPPGVGQGANFTEWFSQFQLTKITAGIGATGKQSTDPIRYGGGGGGGILLNGTGPSSGAGGCCNANLCGPSGATGYGAGGSAGCRNVTSAMSTYGGNGASGVVYIEFYA